MKIEKNTFDVLFGNRIKALIDLRQLTQSKFAAQLGISETFLSLIIHGKRGMSKTKVLKTAGILDVHPLTLTTERNIPADKLMLYDMFVRILDTPEDFKSFPAIKTLIESEFSK